MFGLWDGMTGVVAQVPHPRFEAVHGDLARSDPPERRQPAVLGSYGESEPDGVQTLTEVLWLATAGARTVVRAGEAAFEVDNEADVYPSPGDAISALGGDGGAVVYSTGGRLRSAGSDAASDLGVGEIVAADGSRLLARVAGRLAVVENGVAGRRFPSAPVGVLDEDLVITLADGRIVARAAESGRTVHSHPLDLDPAAAATLDVSRGLATYVRDGQVHMLRLSDGRRARLALPPGAAGHVEAEIERDGLFLSYGVYRREPGRIAFYPYDAVAAAVDRAS